MRLWRWLLSALAGPDPDPVERALYERAEARAAEAERSAVALAETLETLDEVPELELVNGSDFVGPG